MVDLTLPRPAVPKLPLSMLIGDWIVDTATGIMTRDEQLVRLDERTLRLLLCLARDAGAVLSMEDLLEQVWPGIDVPPESVQQTITSLRRLLGDDTAAPSYILEVPRKGYRLIAAVADLELATDEPFTTAPLPAHGKRPFATSWWLAGGALLLAIAAAAYLQLRAPPKLPATLAVLPLLEMTNTRRDAPFADPMTQELIEKLRHTPGLGVATAAQAFQFRGKPVTFSEFATALNVNYVLDGSVVRTGKTMRVAVRVTRAVDGVEMWSETYDRPFDDKDAVQEDIAVKVGKALTQ